MNNEKHVTIPSIERGVLFTDIHFGRKNNSETHNTDCINYINWLCEYIKNSKNKVDYIAFLGDWHEHRGSINGLTLKFSFDGAKMLNNLGIPVFFIIGNHDLYYRNSREVFSTNPFEALENFILVNDAPVIVNKKFVFLPFLFHEEYRELSSLTNYEVMFGHFEFQGFVVTGNTIKLEHGPDHRSLKSVRKIFSGHFHKRQNQDNVHFIGNSFPADYSDANDNDRGLCVFTNSSDNIEYVNWIDCPSYIKTTLTDILVNHKKILKNQARVNCEIDSDITYDEINKLREKLEKKYNLRELTFEEKIESIITDNSNNVDLTNVDLYNTNKAVTDLLEQIDVESLDKNKLIKIYQDAK